MKTGVPVDEGWAWMVCLGSFVSLFFMQGTVKSLGILLVQFINYYQAEQGTTALVLGVVLGTWSLLTPLVMAATQRISYRQVIIVSGLLCCGAAVLTIWASNVYTCIAVFGLLTGTGYACLLAPTMAVLSVYFEKRISLANGVASAGGSIGQLLWPVFLTYLLKTYNLQGTLVIYGGCFLHLLIGAALMRPRSFYTGRSEEFKHPAVIEIQNLETAGSGILCEETLLDKQVEVTGTSPGSQPSEDVFGLENETEETVFVKTIKNSEVDSGTAHAEKTKADGSADVQTELEIRKDTHKPSRLDCSLFCHPLFLAFAFGVTIAVVGSFGFYHFLPAFCQDIGISEDGVALILFVTGIVDLAAHFLGGWFGDLNVIRRYNLVGCWWVGSGTVIIVAGIFPSFPVFLTTGIFVGIFAGASTAVYVVVLRDYVGPARFPAAFGLTVLLRSVLSIPAPYILGRLRDVTGTYRTTFCVCGSCWLVAAVTCFLAPCLRRWTDRLETKTLQSNNVEHLARKQA